MDGLKKAASFGAFGLMPALFSSDTPKPPKPMVMPDPDSDAIRRAKQREIMARQASSGRQSTILGGSPSGTLGG